MAMQQGMSHASFQKDLFTYFHIVNGYFRNSFFEIIKNKNHVSLTRVRITALFVSLKQTMLLGQTN